MSATAEASRVAPSPALEDERLKRIYAAIALSAILAFASFHPLDAGFLAWVALVPVLFVAALETRRAAIVMAFTSTALYHVVGLAWIAMVTPEGWLITSFLEGFYGAALVCVPLWLRRRAGVPLFASLALLGPVLEAIRGYYFPFIAFPWLLWGHTQHAQLTLIQLADITSVYGISSLVLAVNGGIVDVALLLRGRWLALPAKQRGLEALLATLGPRDRQRLAVYAGVPLGAIALALAYGVLRLRQVEASLQPGPDLLVVQVDIPQSLKDGPTSGDTVARRNLEVTQAGLRARGPDDPLDAIVWSETMWPWPLPDRRVPEGDGDAWDVWLKEEVLRNYGAASAHMVRTLTRELLNVATHTNATLLVGAVDRGLSGGRPHNSYYAIAPNPPKQAEVVERYDKIALVPVSEYIPFENVTGMGWFFALFKSFVPPGFTVFERGGGPKLMRAGEFQLAPNICFEISFPEVLRRSTKAGADVHVCPANDGWFVRGNPFFGQEATATAEVPLARAHTRFRAIENRRSFVRCVNRGTSLVCDPRGEFVEELLGRERRPVGFEGFLRTEPPDCDLMPFYVRFGNVYVLACALAAAGLIVAGRQGRRLVPALAPDEDGAAS